MWKLTIVDDEGKKTDLPLSRGEYNVGRDEENTVRLTDRNISRKHLVLRRNGNEAWIVEDLSSYNGCFVNGLRVPETHPLQHGDLLQLGDYRLELSDETVLAPSDGAESALTVPAPTTSRFLDRPDRFVVVDGEGAGTEFPLEGEKMIIGRAEDAEISINHSSVSRVHAEIMLLESGRYEIVDRSSSNGIRVNGIKLERRVIEDDDEIELGDVRLRFVAKGRIYRPGAPHRTVSVSPTSAASTTLRPGQRKTSFGIVVAAGAVLGLIVVGSVFVITRPQTIGSQVTSVSGPVQIDSSSTLVTDAQRLLAAGDLEGAHNKVNLLPDPDGLRTSPEVKAVEAAWADASFSRAGQEADLAKRKIILGRVSAAILVDQERRQKAADMIQALEASGATDPRALPSAATSGTSIATTDRPLPSGLAPNPFETPPVKSGKEPPSKPAAPTTAEKPTPKDPPATTAAPAPTGADAMKTALDGNDGPAKARKMLEPKVWSGRASPEEIKMLIAICRQMHDSACVSRARQLLQDANNKK